MRNYSELSEEEKLDVFNKYKKHMRTRSNIFLLVYFILFIIAISIDLVLYNKWKSDYIVEDLVNSYVSFFFKMSIVVIIIIFIVVIIISLLRRKRIKNKTTRSYQNYLSKRKIFLDKVDN